MPDSGASSPDRKADTLRSYSLEREGPRQVIENTIALMAKVKATGTQNHLEHATKESNVLTKEMCSLGDLPPAHTASGALGLSAQADLMSQDQGPESQWQPPGFVLVTLCHHFGLFYLSLTPMCITIRSQVEKSRKIEGEKEKKQAKNRTKLIDFP